MVRVNRKELSPEFEHGFFLFKKGGCLHAILHRGAFERDGVMYFTDGQELSTLCPGPKHKFDLEQVLASREVDAVSLPFRGDFLNVPLFAPDFSTINRLRSTHEVGDFALLHLRQGAGLNAAANAFEKFLLRAGQVETIRAHSNHELDFQRSSRSFASSSA